MNKVMCQDIDGCLADFEAAFVLRFGSNRQDEYKLERRYPKSEKEIGAFVNDPKTYIGLPVIDLGKRINGYLSSIGYKIHVCTSRPAEAKQVTHSWLRGAGIQFCSLTVGRNKMRRIELLQPQFIIDDMLSVARQAANQLDIPVFLIDSKWNQEKDLPGNIHRISTYGQFMEIFSRLYE